jgi:hypothetical protein
MLSMQTISKQARLLRLVPGFVGGESQLLTRINHMRGTILIAVGLLALTGCFGSHGTSTKTGGPDAYLGGKWQDFQANNKDFSCDQQDPNIVRCVRLNKVSHVIFQIGDDGKVYAYQYELGP